MQSFYVVKEPLEVWTETRIDLIGLVHYQSFEGKMQKGTLI